MASILVALVFVVALLGLGLASRAGSGPYAERIDYGPLVIPFSAVDRVCYLLAILSVVVGVGAGVFLIWGPDGHGILGRVATTAALVCAGSLLVLMLNRLTRGRVGP